jgi:hypothetical protein
VGILTTKLVTVEEASVPAESSNSKFVTPAVRAYPPKNIFVDILGYQHLRRAVYLCEPIRPSVRHKK